MSDRFYKFVKIAMKCQEIMKNEYGLTEEDEYIVPTNITKLDDIKNQMIASGEFIMNDEDD